MPAMMTSRVPSCVFLGFGYLHKVYDADVEGIGTITVTRVASLTVMLLSVWSLLSWKWSVGRIS